VNNVGLFSFGTAGSADRALGSRATAAVAGNDPVLYGVRLVNNTGKNTHELHRHLTGEQWFKIGKTTADTLLLDYKFGASDIASGTWTAATGGTFTSLINTATAATFRAIPRQSPRPRREGQGVSWAPGAGTLGALPRHGQHPATSRPLAVDDFYFFR